MDQEEKKHEVNQKKAKEGANTIMIHIICMHNELESATPTSSYTEEHTTIQSTSNESQLVKPSKN